MSQWKTLSDYTKKYNYSAPLVQTWIAQGVVPEDCVIVVPELNYIKQVRDRPYETSPCLVMSYTLLYGCGMLSYRYPAGGPLELPAFFVFFMGK